MKRLIFILPFCTLPILLSAQTYDVGIRHGISLRMQKNGIGQGSFGFASDQCATYDKAFFVRKRSNKLIYEIAASHHQYKTNEGNILNNVYEMQYSLHYDITYPGLAYILPFLKNMQTYVGVSTIPSLLVIKNEGVNGKKWSLQTGIHYTRIVPITRNINFSTQFFYITGLTDRYQSMRDGYVSINKRLGFNTSFSLKL